MGITALALLLPALSFADAVNNEWLSTTRNLSMGNAGVASSEDPTSAMFYNPAALSRAKATSLDLLNPQIDVGTNVLGGRNVSNMGDNLSLQKAQAGLKAHPYKASSLGGAIYPNFYTRNLNVGMLLSQRAMSWSDGTSTYYRARSLVMPTVGLTAAILNGRFRVGVAGRAIRWSDNDRSTKDTTNLSYFNGAGKGWGIALDAGALLAFPIAGLPTLGVVARNIGGTKFHEGAITDAPLTGQSYHQNPLPMTYDAGFAIFPRLGGRSSLTLAVDYRDVTNHTGVTMLRHVNAGAELSFSKTFYLRTGMSQGYFTGGIGLASRLGTLDLGTYAEELDPTQLAAHADRRVSFRYGRRF